MQQHPVPPASNTRHEVFFFQQSSLVIIFLLAKGAFQLSSGTDHIMQTILIVMRILIKDIQQDQSHLT